MTGHPTEGQRIREAYEAWHLDQKEFADLVGVHPDTLRTAERGGPVSNQTGRKIRATIALLDLGEAEVLKDVSLTERHLAEAQRELEHAIQSGRPTKDVDAARQVVHARASDADRMQRILALVRSWQADTPRPVSEVFDRIPGVATAGDRGEGLTMKDRAELAEIAKMLAEVATRIERLASPSSTSD